MHKCRRNTMFTSLMPVQLNRWLGKPDGHKARRAVLV
jgi:hypothetical protein